MKLSSKAQHIYSQLEPSTKLGDLRKIAKEIKTDHKLALELWSTSEFIPRQLAILILDKKLLSQEVIDQLDKDIQNHNFDEQNQLADWLMANQLMKNKKTISLIESWKSSSSPIQRRIFWYYQARLRWMGNTNHSNTADLLNSIEKNLVGEKPEVQWAMNFTAGWIGVFDKSLRARCIDIGNKLELFKDEIAPKGCTPNYLPDFIAIETGKRKNK